MRVIISNILIILGLANFAQSYMGINLTFFASNNFKIFFICLRRIKYINSQCIIKTKK